MIDPDLDEKISVTVIATGFEEKRRTVMPAYEKWRPSRDTNTLRSSSRVLAKDTLKSNDNEDSYLDVPTFMRKTEFDDKDVKTL